MAEAGEVIDRLREYGAGHVPVAAECEGRFVHALQLAARSAADLAPVPYGPLTWETRAEIESPELIAAKRGWSVCRC
jgi:hypothetical protein